MRTTSRNENTFSRFLVHAVAYNLELIVQFLPHHIVQVNFLRVDRVALDKSVHLEFASEVLPNLVTVLASE
jgi:hypothetical protein